MKKIYWLLLPTLLVAVFFLLYSEKKIYLAGEQLPILDQFEGKDWRGEKSWGFITSIEGVEKAFEIYPAVFEALVHKAAVAINLDEIDDQFNGGSDRIAFEHLGKTKENIHLFYIFNVSKYVSNLLFVEFEKNQGASLYDLHNGKKHIFYESQVLIKKVGTLPLGSDFYSSEDFIVEENTLKVGSHTFNLCLKSPSLPELITKKLPFRFDKKPFISPVLVDSFIQSVRTGYSSIIAQDLTEAQNNPAYCFLGIGFTNDTEKNYKYIYEGMAKNGVHIVHTFSFHPHPPITRHLFFLYEKDYELKVDWEKKTITRDKSRILLKKIGELDLYLAKPFILTNNTISYTDTQWDNKPYAITEPVDYIDKSMQIELK
jgi:hypothetical protein